MRELERTMDNLTPEELCDFMCGGPEPEPDEDTINPRDILCDHGYEESILFDRPDFDSAIIGVTEEGRVVYDFWKMVEQMQKDDGISAEEAIEFIEYNTIRALPYAGELAPIIMTRLEDLA